MMSDSSMTTCSALRESLLSFWADNVDVSAEDSACVLTFPMKTVDGRYIEVHVEPTLSNYTFVHDGGNTIAELFLQGIHMTDARLKVMSQVARRYGASFDDNRFTAAVKPERVNDAILAIAQCASVAMVDIVKHQPALDDEVIAAVVRRTLQDYRPLEVEMRYRFIAKGEHEHVFDAIAFPRVARRRAVAVKTLGSAYNPKIQSERYGFLALDLKDTDAGKWPRVAVVAKAERWSSDHLKLVRSYSDKTIELRSGDDAQIHEMLPTVIDQLADKAA